MTGFLLLMLIDVGFNFLLPLLYFLATIGNPKYLIIQNG